MTISLASMIHAAATQEEWQIGSGKKTKPPIVKNGYVNVTDVNGYSKRIIIKSENDIVNAKKEIDAYTGGAPKHYASAEDKPKTEPKYKKNLTLDYKKRNKYLSIALDLELLLKNKNAAI